MKCLVTGGAGFIGSNLVDALVARGDDVRVFDNFSTGERSNLAGVARAIETVEGDLRDVEAVRAACRGRDVVFHLAAMPSVPRSIEDPATSFDVNVRGTFHVFAAAREAGVTRVVYSASSSAYGDTPTLPKIESMPPAPKSPYAADKLYGETLCRVYSGVYGMECAALRYFNIFGPRQRPDSAYAAVIPRFVDAFRRGERPTIYGDGEQSRDFTFVANAVRANLLAAERDGLGGRVFNVGNGVRTTLNELLRVIAVEMGTKPDARYEPERAGDVKHSLADIGLARRELGYQPAVSLEEGLKATVAWFRAAGR
ncbi:MAG TPA: SDR family oxidoreductase [Planctomycetota bacterium]|nr:SDR family oxidoreductase [Planctomycetota bacterium]